MDGGKFVHVCENLVALNRFFVFRWQSLASQLFVGGVLSVCVFVCGGGHVQQCWDRIQVQMRSSLTQL